ELAEDKETGRQGDKETEIPKITVWRPIDRHRPETWEQVPVERVEIKPTDKSLIRSSVSLSPCLLVSLSGSQGRHEVVFPPETQQQMDLRTTADWVIRPRLLKVSGVAEVFILGGERKQYQVLLDPAALLEYDVTLQQVEQALKDNNLN